MKLVLLERVENLGAMGDVVSVRPGFARNFLLPQEKALRATEANLARFEAEREALEKRNAERAAEAAPPGGGPRNVHATVSAREHPRLASAPA